MYISEVAPPNIRGALLAMEGATIVIGIVVMFYIVSIPHASLYIYIYIYISGLTDPILYRRMVHDSLKMTGASVFPS